MSPRDTAPDCVSFLQWCLPLLGLRWRGYRRVRGTVCKRLRRRLRELGLADLGAYRALLERDAAEWGRLEAFCRIPISRFYRDRRVFDAIADTILPMLARAAESGRVACWSAGCAGGEEPYSLALIWTFRIQPEFPGLAPSILATDADEGMVERGRRACYARSAVRELPPDWIAAAFDARDELLCLGPRWRSLVEFRVRDIRDDPPPGRFDLILCRNAAFTYFPPAWQARTEAALSGCLRPGGFLVVGTHEKLPDKEPWLAQMPIYRKPA